VVIAAVVVFALLVAVLSLQSDALSRLGRIEVQCSFLKIILFFEITFFN
jgi:hypothetical protein